MVTSSLKIDDDPAVASNAREFNKRVSAGRLTDFTCEGQPLSTIIIEELKTAIAERYPDHDERVYDNDLQKEVDQQGEFLLLASDIFIKRDRDFDELESYVSSDSNHLFALTAVGGIGKSTLLANWINSYRQKRKSDGEASIHFRFIGSSSRSYDIDTLLQFLVLELKAAGKFPGEIPADPFELRASFADVLRTAGQGGKTVIVFDALDQLEKGLSDLQWLPVELPG